MELINKTGGCMPEDNDAVVEIRYPDGRKDKVREAAADVLCRKAGCVDIAKEKAAKKAAEKAAKEKAAKRKSK